jgi:hypothetical protein
MAPVGNTGRASAADSRRLRLSHLRGARLGRLLVVLAVLVAAAVYAGVAHADNAVVVDVSTTTTPGDTSTGGTLASDSTATDPTTDPSSSPTDPTGTPTEPSTDPTTVPPADTPGTDPTTPPAGDPAPAPEPVGSGDPAGGSEGETPPVATEPPPPVDTPPVIDPVTPVVDDPSTSPPADGNPKQPAVPPSFPSGGITDVGLPLAAQVAAPLSLDLLRISGATSTKGREARPNDDTRSTKEQSARRSFPSEGSPSSSPSSAASGGASGSSGSGGGVALAVEFLLAALVVLRYTRKAAFILPDSLAFALREARPG